MVWNVLLSLSLDSSISLSGSTSTRNTILAEALPGNGNVVDGPGGGAGRAARSSNTTRQPV